MINLWYIEISHRLSERAGVLGEDEGRKRLAESAFKMADNLHEYANEKDVCDIHELFSMFERPVHKAVSVKKVLCPELSIITELGTKKSFLLTTESNPKSYPSNCMKKRRANAFKRFLNTIAAR